MQSIKHEWTPAEKQQLLKIKNNDSRKEKLEAFIVGKNITYAEVYSKWNYLHHQAGTFKRIGKGGPVSKADKNETIFMAPVVKNSSVNIQPMKFDVIENFNPYNRVDAKEQIALEAGLDAVIKNKVITAENKRGINIPRKLAQRVKKYLSENYPEHAYSVSTGKNVAPGFAVVSRTK